MVCKPFKLDFTFNNDTAMYSRLKKFITPERIIQRLLMQQYMLSAKIYTNLINTSGQ